MQTERARRETEALIEAIWGPQTTGPQKPPDIPVRRAQNRALAAALKVYLDQYLADDSATEPAPHPPPQNDEVS